MEQENWLRKQIESASSETSEWDDWKQEAMKYETSSNNEDNGSAIGYSDDGDGKISMS